MTNEFHRAMDAMVRDGDPRRCSEVAVALAALESKGRLRFPLTEEYTKQIDELIQLLLAGDEQQIAEGLSLLDRYCRYETCGILRKTYPNLLSQDLADIWQDLLVAMWRKALQHSLQVEQSLADTVWTVADRLARQLRRIRLEEPTFEASRMAADEPILAQRWRMLTGLQQEEVRDLIRMPRRPLPAAARTVWDAYLGFIGQHARAPSSMELTRLVTRQQAAGVARESLETSLDISRQVTFDSLYSHGYDIFATLENAPDRILKGYSQPLDRLVSEAFYLPRPEPCEPEGGGRAAKLLTEADRDVLDRLPPDLATRARSKYRTLRMWRSSLWSDRRTDCQTYLTTRTIVDQRRRPSQSTPIDELVLAYHNILRKKRLEWAPQFHFVALLGEGGQGVVYLVRRPGVDGFHCPFALKILAPDRYTCAEQYITDSRRMARTASIVADINHPNLLDVLTYEAQAGVRMMLMEWVKGYDLARLMVPAMLERLRERATPDTWDQLSSVVVCEGHNQPRLLPFIAVVLIKNVLAALEKLHESGIVHGDIKPSNIMLTPNGYVKLIDFGSAFVWNESPSPHHCTYRYAAPEVLQRHHYTPRSDLASLGYVLVELLTGRALFAEARTVEELIEEKLALPDQLARLLPEKVRKNDALVELCRKLIDPEPEKRFASAYAAHLQGECGAQAILDGMYRCGFGIAFEADISHWLKTLG